MWIDKLVKVTFTDHWPITSAVYRYEGHDSGGIWVRSKSGRQRYLAKVDVALIEAADVEAHEGEY
jgi:hypothetical protein